MGGRTKGRKGGYTVEEERMEGRKEGRKGGRDGGRKKVRRKCRKEGVCMHAVVCVAVKRSTQLLTC